MSDCFCVEYPLKKFVRPESWHTNIHYETPLENPHDFLVYFAEDDLTFVSDHALSDVSFQDGLDLLHMVSVMLDELPDDYM